MCVTDDSSFLRFALCHNKHEPVTRRDKKGIQEQESERLCVCLKDRRGEADLYSVGTGRASAQGCPFATPDSHIHWRTVSNISNGPFILRPPSSAGQNKQTQGAARSLEGDYQLDHVKEEMYDS